MYSCDTKRSSAYCFYGYCHRTRLLFANVYFCVLKKIRSKTNVLVTFVVAKTQRFVYFSKLFAD